jgi:hypothetical protein
MQDTGIFTPGHHASTNIQLYEQAVLLARGVSANAPLIATSVSEPKSLTEIHISILLAQRYFLLRLYVPQLRKTHLMSTTAIFIACLAFYYQGESFINLNVFSVLLAPAIYSIGSVGKAFIENYVQNTSEEDLAKAYCSGRTNEMEKQQGIKAFRFSSHIQNISKDLLYLTTTFVSESVAICQAIRKYMDIRELDSRNTYSDLYAYLGLLAFSSGLLVFNTAIRFICLKPLLEIDRKISFAGSVLYALDRLSKIHESWKDYKEPDEMYKHALWTYDRLKLLSMPVKYYADMHKLNQEFDLEAKKGLQR